VGLRPGMALSTNHWVSFELSLFATVTHL